LALTAEQVHRFVVDGFVKLPAAFPVDVGEQCRRELWDATGYDPDDPTTWTDSLVRLEGFGTPPFRNAANTPALHAAFDQLVGAGGWLPRAGLGTFALRFPSQAEPRDAGWHVESSFTGPHRGPRLNLHSRERALLMLFLFSDIGPADAPTLVRVGSHLDVPPLLEPGGDDGVDWMQLCQHVVPISAHRPVEPVTGTLGDVYLCHPFIVHAGQAHHGHTPRFMAQPPLAPTGLLDLDAEDPTPVARAVINGLQR